MLYICNAISLGMVPAGSVSASLRITEIAAPTAYLADAEAAHGPAQSAVGHADTAALFTALLGRPVAPARVTLQFSPDDEYLVGQLSGPRLPEGAITLPAGASIRWMLVTFEVGV